MDNERASFHNQYWAKTYQRRKGVAPSKNGEGEGSLVNAMRCTNKPRTMEGGCQGDDLRGAAAPQRAQLCNAR